MKPVRPKTRKEWQEAVNAAYTCLCIDSCVQYGLLEVVGSEANGSGINVERCQQIILSGLLIGIRPTIIDEKADHH